MDQNRKYGVELEVEGLTVRSAREALRTVQVPMNVTNSNQGSHDLWCVVEDCSLDRGAEVVSPILTGDEGKKQIKQVTAALAKAGAIVSTNCGLHVHVDVSDFTLPMLRTLVHRYAHFEPMLDRLVAATRRGGRSAYARSMRDFIQEYDHLMTKNLSPAQFAQQIQSRYFKLNLSAVAKYGTVEFRQHQGSIDAVKINAWVQFVVNFVEETKAAHKRWADSLPHATNSNIAAAKQESRDKMFELLCMFIAASTHNMCGLGAGTIADKLDWSRGTVPVMISKLRSQYGVTVRKRRNFQKWDLVFAPDSRAEIVNAKKIVTELGARRVLSEPLSTASPNDAKPSFVGDKLFTGLPPELIAWFQERDFELNAA